MSILHSPVLHRYGVGLACTAGGAGVSSLTGSMLPLAMGAAVAVLCTARLVREIRRGAAARRLARRQMHRR